jgi:hypothetical protein
MKNIALIIAIVIGVTVIAGAINVGSSMNHDQATSDRVSAVWSQVAVGMTEDQVSQILGEPDDTSHSESSNFEGGVNSYDDWTYGTLGDTTYSVSFINGRLDSKLAM